MGWFSRREKPAPALAPSLGEMAEKIITKAIESQASTLEASGKLLTVMHDLAARDAARLLGRRRANNGPRDSTGRYKKKSACRVCENPSSPSLTTPEILHHNSGHTNGAAHA